MKRYKKTIIVAVLLWVPLAVVVFIHSSDESMLKRILVAIASGPIMFFMAGLASLLVSALMTGAFCVTRHLEAFKVKEEDSAQKMFEYGFNGAFGVIFVIMYYFAITNQHLFYRIYGGW